MLKNGDVVGKSSCNVPCFMLYYERCQKTRMWIPSKVPKSRQKFRPVAKESKTYGRKKPNGGE